VAGTRNISVMQKRSNILHSKRLPEDRGRSMWLRSLNTCCRELQSVINNECLYLIKRNANEPSAIMNDKNVSYRYGQRQDF
jgi:hypothetical protein